MTDTDEQRAREAAEKIGPEIRKHLFITHNLQGPLVSPGLSYEANEIIAAAILTAMQEARRDERERCAALDELQRLGQEIENTPAPEPDVTARSRPVTIYEKLARCETPGEVERMLRGNGVALVEDVTARPAGGLSLDGEGEAPRTPTEESWQTKCMT